MKKVFFAAMTVLALASCKKEWTCECTVTSGDTSTTNSYTSGKMKKVDAKTWCNLMDQSAYQSCDLK